MWLITRVGFFSVVQKCGESGVTVRSRSKGDLKQLRDHYLPGMGKIADGEGEDYPYRARVSHRDFADALRRMAMDINYESFQQTVLTEKGDGRSRIYGDVRRGLLGIKDD